MKCSDVIRAVLDLILRRVVWEHVVQSKTWPGLLETGKASHSDYDDV